MKFTVPEAPQVKDPAGDQAPPIVKVPVVKVSVPALLKLPVKLMLYVEALKVWEALSIVKFPPTDKFAVNEAV